MASTLLIPTGFVHDSASKRAHSIRFALLRRLETRASVWSAPACWRFPPLAEHTTARSALLLPTTTFATILAQAMTPIEPPIPPRKASWPIGKTKRQPLIVFIFEAYVFLGNVALMGFNYSRPSVDPEPVYIILGCIIATLGLLISGTVLLFRGPRLSGWIAFGIAAYEVLFLVFFLPRLAQS